MLPEIANAYSLLLSAESALIEAHNAATDGKLDAANLILAASFARQATPGLADPLQPPAPRIRPTTAPQTNLLQNRPSA